MTKATQTTSPRSSWSRFIIFGMTFILLTISSPTWGQGEQVITMKSTLQYIGKIVNVSAISEQVGGALPKNNKPILFIDNGLTRTFINKQRISQQVGGIVDAEINEFSQDIWQRAYKGPPGAAAFAGVTPFDEHGHRIVSVRNAKGLSHAVQGITKIGPRHVQVRALAEGFSGQARSWDMSLAIGTVPSDILQSVLENSIEDRKRVTSHLGIVDFFVQAGRFQDADDQLRRIQTLFPSERERVEENRVRVRQEFAKQQLREIKLMLDAGQTKLASQWMKSINRTGVEGETTAELDFLLEDIEKADAEILRYKEVVQELLSKFRALPAGQLTASQTKTIDQFTAEVDTDLDSSNFARLSGFERLANDPTQTDQQLLALAISGWTLGSNGAIDNWAIAQSLIEVRELVREYLLTSVSQRREEILKELEKFESSDPASIASIIAQMKPLKHDLVAEHDGRKPIEFTVSIEGAKADPQVREYRCLAHLPSEYSPYRRYRLMVSLPGASTIENQLDHFCGPFNERLGVRHGNASRNGTIVLAVDWRNPGQRSAEYSVREHKIVMRALREAMRRFSIDTDQVFLQGHGAGADVAYDVALSHPEHWAGVIAISANGIKKYPLIYADNEPGNLSIYAVVGSKHIGGIRDCKSAWNKWLSTKLLQDCTVVQYKGRLDERFAENIPEMFKWMRVQRRRNPDGLAGFKFVCESLRPWDNYYWFVELHGLPEKNTRWPALWEEKGPKPLKITGDLRAGNSNTFHVGPATGGTGMTLWLRPDYFDFSKQITINGRGRKFNEAVRASRNVLLEDARQRVDFKRPYWAKVECAGGRWSVPE